ncbi:NAD(P)/FAD-dependent oxidoreductase [Dyadobacter sp. CY312]|uniref:NAD(P)/FAD-dependent oxidoreductase n=1 Tax=Dyadobacter sp. CY312 TaxID=2907303 RepID=UPI001F34741E|nr:NAD(P)/FAD-dependent oxidoreductase [Dyadobacter sp. CY312]MCE7042628.1 NAD(P)/FAD-dependent oxidoreductase [Dyadobacter sp. CY312]
MENMDPTSYDCAIIGGGLSGLCLSIQLAEAGFSVVVFEKNRYPFHKVCGEYISMESWNFLNQLGLPLGDMDLPVIDQLGISSQRGFMLNHTLKMGGFGISRFTLDHQLSSIAVSKGVIIKENCRVTGVRKADKQVSEIDSSCGTYHAKIVCGSYGKYTPSFLQSAELGKGSDGMNYIGVKYHVRTDLPTNRIELHNFENGYCGISKVDNDWQCLCYLTTANNLNKNSKDIGLMERNVLFKNPFLKKYFTESEFLTQQPLVISNVSFKKKSTDNQGIFLLGDSAGSITPLCGNGMSMGMRASKLLAAELIAYLNNKQTKEQTLVNYKRSWDKNFGNRIKVGYYLQYLFGKNATTDLALRVLSQLPPVTSKLVSLTHGERF